MDANYKAVDIHNIEPTPTITEITNEFITEHFINHKGNPTYHDVHFCTPKFLRIF